MDVITEVSYDDRFSVKWVKRGKLWKREAHYPECIKSPRGCQCAMDHHKKDTVPYTRKQEIKERAKELQREVKRQLKKDGMKVLARGKLSTEQIEYISTFQRSNPLASEYRALMREFWSLGTETISGTQVTEQNTLPWDGMVKIKSVYAGAYRSQGWGKDKYTFGVFEYAMERMQEANIPHYLIDNGAEWVLYAAEEVADKRTPVEWAQYHWRKGRNPRVYNPFLPYIPEFEFGYKEPA